MSANTTQLIAQLRNEAPFSENGCLYLRAANAIEDAEARVVLAKADALNEAAEAWVTYQRERMPLSDVLQIPAWLGQRAKAIEVGEI